MPLLAYAVFLPLSSQHAQGQASFEKTVLPFIADNCVFCHNAKKPSGGLNLEKFQTAASLSEGRETWEHAIQKIQSGEMPPKGAPKPDQAEVKTFISFLESEFARADKNVKPDPGRVTARRLNRAEYNNTVRDLLGVDINPSADFPQDDSGYGFDNIGDVLSISPVLMEKYLTAAEKIARTAMYGTPPMKPAMVERRGQSRKLNTVFEPIADYDTTGLSLPNALHITHRFPVDAEYDFRLFLNGQRPPGSAAVKFALWIDGKQVQVKELDPEGRASFSENKQDFDAFNLEFRAKVSAGEHWIAATPINLFDGLPASFNGPNPSTKTPPPVPEFKDRPDVSAEINARRRKGFEERLKVKAPVNNVRVSRADIGGPTIKWLAHRQKAKRKFMFADI